MGGRGVYSTHNGIIIGRTLCEDKNWFHNRRGKLVRAEPKDKQYILDYVNKSNSDENYIISPKLLSNFLETWKHYRKDT